VPRTGKIIKIKKLKIIKKGAWHLKGLTLRLILIGTPFHNCKNHQPFKMPIPIRGKKNFIVIRILHFYKMEVSFPPNSQLFFSLWTLFGF